MIELVKEDLAEGRLYEFDLDGVPVLVAKVGGRVYAIGGRCTHLGCRLVEGTLRGTIVTCPCHGTKFDMATGDVVRALTAWPRPLAAVVSTFVREARVYRVREAGGKVFVEDAEEEE